ncbi:ankyrin repeat family protein [Lyophyllum atratum]|nr:ankyrin repeat family protein [Lyophyllum atratum]
MSSLQMNDCVPKFSTTRGEHPRVFKNITLNINHPEFGLVGSLSAVKIIRHFCRGSFLEVMDDHSDELHQFSITLFDKFGRVRPFLLEQGNRRGTGCWGSELNNDQLIYVLDMNVNEKYRGKGLGSWMLGKLLAAAFVTEGDTVACRPTPINVEEKAEWANITQKQVAFFRKNGFRRIGRTCFFGYSPNSNHPSREISITADAEEQSRDFDTTADQGLTPEELEAKYPLHFAIVNFSGAYVVNIIKAHYKIDPSSIHKADASGLTPIYAALGRTNIHAVQALLDLGVADDMQNAQNAGGMTPLEGLADKMRSTRECAETMTGVWNGYSTEELTCEFLAKRAMGMPTLADNLEAYVTKRKWGCTCGVCAGGWLSKRMRFRLEVRAGSSRDVMNEEIGYSGFKRGVAHTDPMVLSEIDYVPSHLHQSVFKTFYVGYQSVFAIILAFLTATDLPLSKDVIQGVISQRILGAEGVTFFFNKGGKIEHALDSITDQAREQSPLGDSSFEEFHADAEDYVPLPTCNNDLEFALVRRMLGLDPELRRGRYYGERSDYGKEVSEYEHLLDDGDYMTGNSTVISLSRLMDISRRIREGHPF